MTTQADLLARLEKVEVNFDATADHHYGTYQPPRVAYVPLELYGDLIVFLRKVGERSPT